MRCSGFGWSAWVVLAAVACSADSVDTGGRMSGIGAEPTPAPGQDGTAGTPGRTPGAIIGADNPTSLAGEPMMLPPMESSCGSTDITVSRVLPSVMLLVDGSQSMLDPYGDPVLDMPDGGVADPAMQGAAPAQSQRWTAVRDALADPDDGVVAKLEGLVRFGLAVYGTTPQCPLPLGTLEPVLHNYQAIEASLPQQPPGLTTPTGIALDRIVDLLPDPKQALDETIGPQIIILATDGDPNSCELPLQNYEPSIQAAMKAQAKNLRMYVISVGQDAAEAHLQEMANLGASMDRFASPGAEVYYPEDPAGLAATLETLIGDELSCELTLDGKGVKQGSECRGLVTLNGEELECNGPDGWSLTDSKTITLQGASCEIFKNASDAMLRANFPCDLLVE